MDKRQPCFNFRGTTVSSSIARPRQPVTAGEFFVEGLLFAGGEECNQRVQSGNCFLTAEQRHHLEEARARRTPRERDADGMDEHARLDPPLSCRSTLRTFHM